MKVPHAAHAVEELCAAGAALYERALREGHVHTDEAGEAPCLVDFGLLYPAGKRIADGRRRAHPRSPSSAVPDGSTRPSPRP
ncbi:hypothetical protein ACPYPG_19720 [Streptomyces sp. FR-108]|uniref:hypothetical protein n=1 Tax=Streptomyces sp. FR-108 TaxID=3416665 RepID=UPI003CFB9728